MPPGEVPDRGAGLNACNFTVAPLFDRVAQQWKGPMSNRTQAIVLIAALIIVVVVGAFFFFVQDYASTSTVIVEEPYLRSEDAPPSAVDDATSHPDLVDESEAVNE
ncbi:uncharacterized protein involved in exopolysaccharide biosynthesis [Pseudorhizobium tarimense]|uniref:Uncharacterized protein involved in exopolysaccharide biosynthesis n=1 Tax=Pseudorhizobium tarimense TaxID=1079109 RepID=A0ABV2H2E9_9HYPH|nr:hypothetical protein [Pseudorhizobium tarimense]MCJ8517681.1 hypothetical protein [Pseudorhizobium tarimense]